MTTGIDGAADRQWIEEPLFEGWERLVGIVQSATDAFIVVDEQQQILAFNPAAERIFGCLKQNALGTHLERFIAPRVRGEHAATFEGLRQTNMHVRSVPTLPAVWGLRANGEEFPCEASIAGHLVRGRREFSVIIRDITERQRLEAALHRRMEFETFLFALSKTFIGLTEEEVDVNMEH